MSIRKQSSVQRGFTLIEVLVSVIIVAFGLIGVAGLLIKSASLGVSAHNRTLATQKVYNMVDRMRLNPAGVRAGSYGNLSGAPGALPDCSAVCTPAQIAGYDFAQWRAGIADALGEAATGSVQASGDRFTITISWPERTLGLTGFDTQSYALDVRP
jgi:type IV pilus assembly protein PilV